jgi:hypothetical protein
MIKIRINFDILVVARLFYEKQKQQKRIGRRRDKNPMIKEHYGWQEWTDDGSKGTSS